MSAAFSNALSGLNANSLAIDNVSGNLANLNTTGYMDNQVSFQDLLSGVTSQNNTSISGSVIAQTAVQFSQGSIQTTSQPFDAAIQGSGFFVLNSPSGVQSFTRAGDFTLDASGNLLGTGGENVQGWNAVDGVLSTSGATSNITLPVSGSLAPVATANFSVSANLDANGTAGPPPTTFSSPVQVYDSEGTAHTLTVTYTYTSANNWSYNVTIPSADLPATIPPTTAPTSVATGTLTFDGNGQLLTPATSASPVVITIPALADGAATPTSLNWNLYNSSGVSTLTQFSEASANTATTQDGSAAGQLTGTSIGANGQISATYSNGSSVVIAQIALASVLNPDSMQNLGNNTFIATSATAMPIIGTGGTGSRGQITGGALEASTVDIATEFTNLLTYERGYQANSKVITTEDDIMQSTVGLIQS
jgi:flagellar hook protein FlgE